MSDLNSFSCTGNLGKDAVEFETKSGKQGVNFSLAISRTYKDGQGQKQTETTWLAIVMFSTHLAQWLKKGQKVSVTGPLSIKEYTDNDGVKRWQTQVIANQVGLLGGKPQQSNDGRPAPSAPSETGQEDDLPF